MPRVPVATKHLCSNNMDIKIVNFAAVFKQILSQTFTLKSLSKIITVFLST